MTEIKTILKYVKNVSDAEEFDCEVNKALNEGYVLKKRRYINAIPYGDGDYLCAVLYAELQRCKNNQKEVITSNERGSMR